MKKENTTQIQIVEHWRFLPETDSKRAEITTDDARQVAEIFGDSRAQREERGCVISAAPELLAACKALRDWCDENPNGSPLEYSKIIEACDTAIERAEDW